jgi:hypothetical protein
VGTGHLLGVVELTAVGAEHHGRSLLLPKNQRN